MERVAGLEIRLLGPVEVVLDEVVVPLRRRRERELLAVLTLERRQLIGGDRLIDLLWGDEPPCNARRMLHTHVSRLRATLRGAERYGLELMSQASGYRLRVPDAAVDVRRFRTLVERARDVPAAADRRALLDEALRMWRGPALADLASTPACRSRCAELEDLRLSALEERFEADLALGRYQDVIAEVRRCAAEFPLRERLTGQLVRALRRVGRRAEALAVFDRHRAELADQLGVDPGPELCRLQLEILREGHSAPPTVITTAPPVADIPTQLPARQYPFQGRHAELAAVDAALAAEPGRPVLLTGLAGVGKTAMGLHWAHRNLDKYPDGQLFVDLAGDPGGVNPAEVLRYLLPSLGVAPESIPGDLGGRSALFRSVVARRRILLLLDNATNTEQVLPFLPGDGACAVIIISRQRLGALPLHRAARTLVLDVLPKTDAVALLRALAADERDGGRAYSQLAASCGNLPLALQIVGARLRSGCPAPLLAAELTGETDRLDHLSIEGGTHSVRAALYRSYEGLPPLAARVLRLLAVHPGPVFNMGDVRALAGDLPPCVTEPLLALVEAHLVRPVAPGWYELHELVRLFAGERLRAEESAVERQAAADRLTRGYGRLSA